MGAKASDHGLLEPYGLEIGERRAEKIAKRFVELTKHPIPKIE